MQFYERSIETGVQCSISVTLQSPGPGNQVKEGHLLASLAGRVWQA